MTPELHIRDLVFTYPDSTPVFQHLSVSFQKGITGLVGGNGSGKTTLLKLLGGQVHGAIAHMEWKALKPQTDTLFLPENSELPLYITAEEILNLAGISIIQNELLEVLGIHHFRHRMIRRCSLGMKKRLVLALALSKNAKLLLLDEPFTGIDIDTLLRLKNYLVRYVHEKLIIAIITSHQLDYLAEISNALLVLKQGHSIFSGTCADLLSQTGMESPLLAYQAINQTMGNT